MSSTDNTSLVWIKRNKVPIGITCAVVGTFFLVLASILIGISVKTVENDEVALVYNAVSKSFDRHQTPLQQGRFVLAVGDKLYKFKRVYVLKSLEGNDSIDCVSRDGLALNLEVTFQYQIKQAQLIDLFLLVGQDYEKIITLQTLAAIRDSCGLYTSSDFYYQRQQVQNEMSNRVDANLETIFCDGGFLQLVNVKFDPAFVTAVQRVQTSLQDITQALNERSQTLTQAQTIVLQAQQTAEIVLTKAKAQAKIILANAEAQGKAINATMSSQQVAFSSIKQALGMDAQGLIDYALVTSMGEINKAVVGLPSLST